MRDRTVAEGTQIVQLAVVLLSNQEQRTYEHLSDDRQHNTVCRVE